MIADLNKIKIRYYAEKWDGRKKIKNGDYTIDTKNYIEDKQIFTSTWDKLNKSMLVSKWQIIKVLYHKYYTY